MVPKVSLPLYHNLLTGDHFTATHAVGVSIWAPVPLLRNTIAALWSMHFPTLCKFNQFVPGTYAQILVIPRPSISMNPHRVLSHNSPPGMVPLKCIGKSSLLHSVTSKTSSTSVLIVHISLWFLQDVKLSAIVLQCDIDSSMNSQRCSLFALFPLWSPSLLLGGHFFDVDKLWHFSGRVFNIAMMSGGETMGNMMMVTSQGLWKWERSRYFKISELWWILCNLYVPCFCSFQLFWLKFSSILPLRSETLWFTR